MGVEYPVSCDFKSSSLQCPSYTIGSGELISRESFLVILVQNVTRSTDCGVVGEGRTVVALDSSTRRSRDSVTQYEVVDSKEDTSPLLPSTVDLYSTLPSRQSSLTTPTSTVLLFPPVVHRTIPPTCPVPSFVVGT